MLFNEYDVDSSGSVNLVLATSPAQNDAKPGPLLKSDNQMPEPLSQEESLAMVKRYIEAPYTSGHAHWTCPAVDPSDEGSTAG